jgi:hypothetical protein
VLDCISFTFLEAEIGFHQFSQKQPIIQKMYAIHKNMRFVQMKFLHGLCWAQDQRLLRIVPMGVGAVIPWIHQPMDHLCKEVPGMLV